LETKLNIGGLIISMNKIRSSQLAIKTNDFGFELLDFFLKCINIKI